MNPFLDDDEKFHALKAAIDEGMADVVAGRVVPWEVLLRQIRERRSVEQK